MRKALLILLFVTTACAARGPQADPVVLASTTILADITRNIAADRLTVKSLLPAGMDPHAYQPVPQDAARISNSQVLVINGAGYERFLESLLENAQGQRQIIEASVGLSAATGAAADPHLWVDPTHVIVYAENISTGLAAFDPAGAAAYESNVAVYISQLEALDAWISEQVALIPPGRRLLVTNHEALGYFAQRYGFTIVGTLMKGFSSDAAPSAQQMAGLVDQIRSGGVPAIFLDASDNPALARQIAAETGVQVVTDLHLESLTEGAPAGTYIDMMKYNVTRIVEALR